MSLRERLDALPTQMLLTIAWVVMLPVAIALGWMRSVTFISAISLYAIVIGHWSAHLAWRAKREASE